MAHNSMTRKTLPFIVKPPEPKDQFAEVGDDRVGKLRVPLYGWLTGAEASLIGSVDPQNEQYSASVHTANALAKAAGIAPVDAYNALLKILVAISGAGKPLGDVEQALVLEHWSLILPLLQLGKRLAEEQSIRRITAMVRRLEGCDDWGDSDSAQLPPTLQQGLAEVAWREEIAMNPEQDPQAQASASARLAEDLGKQLQELSIARAPTGQSSTGSSVTFTRTIRTRRAKGSGSSRPRSSSKRSSEGFAVAGSSFTGQS